MSGTSEPSARHDRGLFDELVARIRVTDPEIRTGAMFGCPTVFAGRRMAFCVFGRAIGAKLPEPRAQAMLAAGAAAFRPYGKSVMREWVQLAPPDDLDAVLPVLAEAIAYARAR